MNGRLWLGLPDVTAFDALLCPFAACLCASVMLCRGATTGLE